MAPAGGLEPTTSSLTGRRSTIELHRNAIRRRLTADERRMAPAVGFEPTTKRLTAARSTTELRRNETPQLSADIIGAGDGARTRGTLLGRQELYH